MSDDIEHLKTHKIKPRRENGRVHLPTLGGKPLLSEDVDEAFGGTGEAPAAGAGHVDIEAVRDRIVDALKQIYDPEIPVNLYDLGLIYGFEVDPEGRVELEMTLTAPACPVAGMLVQDVATRVGRVEGVSQAHVKLVWEPPWTQDRMTEEARLELGLL